MFYPTQVIDGRVHALGGKELKSCLKGVPERSPGVRCPQGDVVVTGAPAGLGAHFSALLHTVPPMWPMWNSTASQDEQAAWANTLRSCYTRTLDHAWPEKSSSQLSSGTSWTHPTLDVVATPVLGAGARKAPFDDACHVAADAVVSWAKGRGGDDSMDGRVLSFALLDEEHAGILEEILGRKLQTF
eukprot:gnl/MRDRNA2_/MRDRNA2_58214_c0_seq1.p1 gnl/MRDRNA2_/MRDRNA2_58214_c0~~gnl/MRDRNA2_/MRDRNA2_58214_c0_seq1.p1  ORF type:complete len:203 (+),score=38.94 gnl/MRDRNA2_/MRDRNA2_58214_c0_seq1:54-611(+)